MCKGIMMPQNLIIIDTNDENILDFGVCGYKSLKRPGFPEKVDWLKDRLSEGLKLKTLLSENDGAQGMIEYLPGEYAWRPVEAKGYTFIHCLFVGFRKEYKGRGYASMLLERCLNDAKGSSGVAVMTRKSSFMTSKEIFQKHGFEVVDKFPSDFELLVKKFDDDAPDPKFIDNRELLKTKYAEGLYILRAFQCPYTVKNVNEMVETARNYYGMEAKVIDLKTCSEAQSNPSAFGTFGIILKGKLVAEHPISNGRFKNILKGMVG